MKGVLGSLPRLALSALVIAIVIAIAFHWAYPDVEITTGLTLEFAFVAVVLAAGSSALWSAVARRGKPAGHDDGGASPPPAGGS